MTPMTPLERKMRDQGGEDARAGRKPTPPTMGGKAADAYTAGYDAAKTEAKPPAKPKTEKGSTRRKAGSGSARTPSRARPTRRARRRPTPYAKTARALQAPIERQLVSGMTVIGIAVGVAVLANFLNHAGAASRFIGGLGTAVAWLDDPNRSITYRE